MTEDLIAYLKTDATLTGLIGAGDSCRMEPNFTEKDPTPPYVTYRLQSDTGRAKGNIGEVNTYSFEIYARTFKAASDIGKSFKRLLDKDAEIAISSSDYFIKSSWKSGGYSTYETDTKLHHLTALYTFVFVEK